MNIRIWRNEHVTSMLQQELRTALCRFAKPSILVASCACTTTTTGGPLVVQGAMNWPTLQAICTTLYSSSSSFRPLVFREVSEAVNVPPRLGGACMMHGLSGLT